MLLLHIFDGHANAVSDADDGTAADSGTGTLKPTLHADTTHRPT